MIFTERFIYFSLENQNKLFNANIIIDILNYVNIIFVRSIEMIIIYVLYMGAIKHLAILVSSIDNDTYNAPHF